MQNLGESLFSSQEYATRNRNNHDYVYDLYKAYLYRDPDSGGWASWEATLNNGTSRAEVRNGFAWAPEFYTKVAGISPYAPPVGVTIPRDGLQGIAYNQATNRIANDGWNYDATGNQTRTFVPGSSPQWQRFQYDAANRLVRVKDDNQTVVASYTYGDDNQRLITEESNTRTYYIAEGFSVIAEYIEIGGSVNPAWSKSYVHLGNRLLSTLTPNGTGGEAVEYHHPDRLGTRIETNPSTGNWSEQVNLPFGTVLAGEGVGTPTNRRFTSYDRSLTTTLDYAVNRHYDSQQGRFTQVDPAGINATNLEDPQTLNLYAYCTNDPVNNTDPSGLGFFSFLKKVFKWIGIAVSVALIVVGIVSLVMLPALAGALSATGVAGATAAALAVEVAAITGIAVGSLGLIAQFVPGPVGLIAGLGLTAWNVYGAIRAFGRSGGLGFSLQGQDGTYRPGDVPGLTGPCPPGACDITIYAGYSIWERLGRSLSIGTDKALTSVVGFSGWITFGGSKYASRGLAKLLGGESAGRLWDQDNAEREASWFYTGGEAAGVVWDVVTGAEVAKAGGWGIRFLRYPNAGGGGINVYRFGVRRFALDWHNIKSLGPRKILHWHWGLTKKAIKLHRGFWTGRKL
jgi:RHS repeat-associated protein